MKFRFVPDINHIKPTEDLVVYMIRDNWNDWWKYKSLFTIYISFEGKLEWIGATKIGNSNLSYVDSTITVEVPEEFEKLDDSFFSLGQDVDYYKNISNQNDDIRESLLDSLNDLAFKPELFKEVVYLDIVQESLLRSVSITSVVGQYNRLAQGQSTLTKYDFNYMLPRPKLDEFEAELYEDPIIEIKVKPNSMPPTNLHVVVGRNGVGKTNLMKSFVTCQLDNKYGEISFEGDFEGEANLFANIITVSFSGFDNSEFYFDIKTELKKPYYEIGLMKIIDGVRLPKTVDDMCEEFKLSLKILSKTGKSTRWKNAIRTLNSDPIFSRIGIEYLIEREYSTNIEQIFKNLSSGHMYVLITITKLVEMLEERSLVVMDEPETHLHPPLIAAFMRAITELLIYRNAVGLIATHSPVIVQEVPARCVNIMNRNNKFVNFVKPRIETFGENVGTLTRAIFGLESSNSGFHKRLKEAVSEHNSYEEIIEHFNNQLGAEARTIVRSLLLQKLRGIED